jgi:hypothetical protein
MIYKSHNAKLLSLAILLYVVSLPVRANNKFTEVFNFTNVKSEYKQDKKSLTVVNKESLNIVFISNVNLFVDSNTRSILNIMPDLAHIPFDSANFTNEPFFLVLNEQAQRFITSKLVGFPDKNSKILYEHSQLLLQEAVRELLASLKNSSIDMVIFAGNQVYSTEQYPSFQEIVQELTRYKVPYYELYGENELKGTRDLSKIIKDKFYLLKTKNTNIIVLDNLELDPVPERLPFEATEQYFWLKQVLSQLDTNEPGSDLIIVSYRKLDNRTKDFLKEFRNLQLKVLVNSELGELMIDSMNGITEVSNPSLSWYPCSYGILTRDSTGIYRFKLQKVSLAEMQDLAKRRSFK